MGSTKTDELLRGLIEADTDLFSECLAELVAATLSYYDTGGLQVTSFKRQDSSYLRQVLSYEGESDGM